MIKGGTLKLGSNLNESGTMELYDETNRLICLLDKTGLTFFNNDNSYNSVLYAYKFDSVNNMFDRIKDVEFSKLQDKDSNGNYIYSNLMKDVDEKKDIYNTANYNGASVYKNRVYKQKLEYKEIEYMVNSYVKSRITDETMSNFVWAIYNNGLSINVFGLTLFDNYN